MPAGGAASAAAPLPGDANSAASGGPAAAGPASIETPVFTGGANQMDVTLYFLRADGEALAPEKRRIFRTATVNDRARQTLQALFEGSEAGLLPSVPPGTQTRELFLSNDGVAYVDLSAEFKDGLDHGSSDAVEAVYAIVNTLSSNFGEIQKVKLLVEGDEVDDLGGHLDLSHPLLPEMSLVGTGTTHAPRPARAVPAPETETPAPPPDDKPPPKTDGPPIGGGTRS